MPTNWLVEGNVSAGLRAVDSATEQALAKTRERAGKYVSHEYDEDIKRINDGLTHAVERAVHRDVISYDLGARFSDLFTIIDGEDITAYRARMVSLIDKQVRAIAPCTEYLTRVLFDIVIPVDRGIGIWLYHLYRDRTLVGNGWDSASIRTWDRQALWGIRDENY